MQNNNFQKEFTVDGYDDYKCFATFLDSGDSLKASVKIDILDKENFIGAVVYNTNKIKISDLNKSKMHVIDDAIDLFKEKRMVEYVLKNPDCVLEEDIY